MLLYWTVCWACLAAQGPDSAAAFHGFLIRGGFS